MKVFAVVLYLMFAFPGWIGAIRTLKERRDISRWYGPALLVGYGVFTILYLAGK